MRPILLPAAFLAAVLPLAAANDLFRTPALSANSDGEYDVENSGVSPDIEIEQDPKLVRRGRDPQLEKAIEVILAELEKNPPPQPRKPPYPDYHK
jgi:C-terminal processing protease CtpA/Prc